jgi:hypothetical protein
MKPKPSTLTRFAVILAIAPARGALAADAHQEHAPPSDTPPDEEPAQLPYAVPRQTLIPGTAAMPGGYHVMVNAYGHLQNVGLGGYRIENANARVWNGGTTYPLLTGDWAMGYARDEHGWIEGLWMLNFEPLTISRRGIPELGQSGEGLVDAQHSHQLIHQAMVALHPLAGLDGWHPESMIEEGRHDLSLFAGQGSATMGPPIFMHRASAPGPTVPRKHHKGENPHETFPVIGAGVRVDQTWFEASAFSALELTPDDSRFYPHPGAPGSFALRVRHVFGSWLELQVSGERLRNQGHDVPDAWQASASAYGWGNVRGWRLDGLVDWALDAGDTDVSGHGPSAQAVLGEFAARTPNRRQIFWARSEYNQREESTAFGEGVSSPWLFETAGFEQVVVGGVTSGLQLGLFGEATYINIPSSLRALYGADSAVTVNVGLHLFGMWLFDSNWHRMNHQHDM